ncbi:PREDICTED: UPF0496 At4g34320 [Prunus dulcis]|uniref:PREDICTED: UPF0496 At4g34320 n=1 Tax=Prunus dulcis TaxID=3755 RepID=A0A5E4EH67_PRUDU|nr:PREDICTED: UPF0496 At4g34320 [Prunus dulcis]
MPAPPVAAALAAASSIPVASMGKWIDSVEKLCESPKGSDYDALLALPLRKIVKVALEEIKKKLVVFMKNVEDLGAQPAAVIFEEQEPCFCRDKKTK